MTQTIATELTETITKLVLEELSKVGLAPSGEPLKYVPVGVSARHVHVNRAHMDILFGPGSELTKFKDISQPGQFAANEQVTLIGPKGTIEKVRILGPLRKDTQAEVSPSDARKLGVNPPVKQSGVHDGTPGITLVGPKGTVVIERGCIVAERHIHMTPAEASAFGVQNGQKVQVKIEGPRGGIMNEVMIRVRDDFALDMHIDTDDGNAFGLKTGDKVEIITE
ncbi:phosphate propanoyltransferase [Paenibacillus albiflavus]|uniref:Phosphate propanoyltransferase n=1 Tax=Paenibacillus albiflavus TaxID=2545760 RepID=A0A4R4EHG3_9BACL|nr:phosphate propanoyltransferase [Paenibacillus albiflavus]TCZ78783.1 phosphate propanoyltransferase [Paenibacillus albiflavus]